jgi:hypothetical protein
MSRLWYWFLARFHFSEYWVCELSKTQGIYDDYHTYKDDVYGKPSHMVLLVCKRCGKRFGM